MIRFRLSHTLAVVACIFLPVLVTRAVIERSDYRPISESELSQILGADKSIAVNTIGDCDSNYAKGIGNGAVSCDGCNANTLQNVCACCDNGGSVDMELDEGNPLSSTSGTDPNSGKKVDCDAADVGICENELDNNGAVIGQQCGQKIIAADDCGKVTQYKNQPITIVPPDGPI